MFVLNKQKHETPLATPWGVFKPGREIDLSKVPTKVKMAWLENKIPDIIQSDKAPDLFEDMPLDGLSDMNRAALKQFAVNHKIPLRVKLTWTDEEVRQAIRELVDPQTLDQLLAAPVTTPVAPPPETSPTA